MVQNTLVRVCELRVACVVEQKRSSPCRLGVVAAPSAEFSTRKLFICPAF